MWRSLFLPISYQFGLITMIFFLMKEEELLLKAACGSSFPQIVFMTDIQNVMLIS